MQDVIDQSGLAGAEEARNNRHRRLFAARGTRIRSQRQNKQVYMSARDMLERL